MPVSQAVAAVEECGAPMVSLAGGEPLMHPQIHEIVNELVNVVQCTNGVLMAKHLHKFTPSKNFAWMVHIDGLRARHDESVSKEGVFDQAVAGIKLAKEAGFQVYTNSTFFSTDSPRTIIDVLNYLNDDLKVDRMEISPGYAYEKAPAQDRFLGVEQTRELFSSAFGEGRRKKWRLRATCWLTGTPRRIPNCSRRPTGMRSGAGKIRGAITAWRTAGTSRARFWPRWGRSGRASGPRCPF